MPFEFQAQSEARSGIKRNWLSQSPSGVVEVCIPPEFSGPGGASSPEDLFNHALTNCFVGTFKVYAENSKLTFERLATSSRLVLDTGPEGKPIMKEFFLKVEITGASDPDRALLLAKKASSSGFILNSVKTQCHFEFMIS